MSKNIEKFEDFEVWKEGINLCFDIYRNLKECKDFSLKDQIQRAAVSIPSNIAEGAGRRTNKDFIRFLDIAKGSINEVQYFLHLASRLDYLSLKDAELVVKAADEVSKCLAGYIKAMESDLK